jgi:hypothetical protein
MIEWNARRLAVLDRDTDAIIRTHARDRKVAAGSGHRHGRDAGARASVAYVS